MTYSKDKTIMKTIRISPSENDNWDINKIHSFLSDKKIERLNDEKPYIYFAVKTKEYLAFLNDFFKDNIEYLMKDPEIVKFIEKNGKMFNKIEKVITNA